MTALSAAVLYLGQVGPDAATGIVGGTGSREIILGLLTGIAFGAILQRVGASSYEMIVNMLRLKDLTIMKFLFLAIAVGSVGMYMLDALGGTANIGIAPLYLGGITVGGLIFGVGWAVSGYCPGTVLAAIGQGKVDALFTIAGGLAGAFTLSLSWDFLKPILVDPLNYGSESLPDVLGTKPLVVALGLAVLIIAFVTYLNRGAAGRSPSTGGKRGAAPQL